ncbi:MULTISPECIES: hypothetical protein [unclassified Streptomyces]|uniref:hypothetical protein n=1 Tax=unclassified Streptomyces TaxID=2593676 RepID=UPI00224FC047|nr:MULTISPECIES: hypothetical protein [unclassified Streptomyces]MCX4403797.1 hypothetical protein [Streptomyces sp. NBC_01764]MCX5181252.1 hypothetical protein [Streptomyces sp. NBC_00268]
MSNTPTAPYEMACTLRARRRSAALRPPDAMRSCCGRRRWFATWMATVMPSGARWGVGDDQVLGVRVPVADELNVLAQF